MLPPEGKREFTEWPGQRDDLGPGGERGCQGGRWGSFISKQRGDQEKAIRPHAPSHRLRWQLPALTAVTSKAITQPGRIPDQRGDTDKQEVATACSEKRGARNKAGTLT